MTSPPSDIKLEDIPAHTRSLTSFGAKTSQVIWDFYNTDKDSFAEKETINFNELNEAATKQQLNDDDVSLILESFIAQYRRGRPIDPSTLARWVSLHNDTHSVIDCINIIPPDRFRIIQVLSRSGSQKLVFHASSVITQKDVVIKQFLSESDKLIIRELNSDPLHHIDHRHIVRTQTRVNSLGEVFVVENKFSVVLNDKWKSDGIHEASNLLYHIGSALRTLHDTGRVHGDVKPDNIAKNIDDYILLDFGICRHIDDFSPEGTATGSIRTRAPELLNRQLEDAAKIDVWALAATIFNAVEGRFPLIGDTETVPRVSDPENRSNFETEIARRANDEWDKWVDVSNIQDPLKSLLIAMLEKDPTQRLSSHDVMIYAERDLAAYLRSSNTDSGDTSLSPIDQLKQIRDYFQIRNYFETKDIIGMVPASKKHSLSDRLKILKSSPGFGEKEKEEIDEFLRELTK